MIRRIIALGLLTACAPSTPESIALDSTVAAPEWVVAFDGIGSLRVGMRIDEALQRVGGTVRVDRIEDGESCGFAYFSALPAGVALMVEADTLVRVDLDSIAQRTTGGMGVGSTEGELRAHYGALLRVEEHAYEGPTGHYLIVDDPAYPGYRFVFETDGQVVTRFRSGRVPDVDYIEGCA